MSERARSPEPGWLGTAGGALLLVVVGFAVGLVAGTAYEEPDLVFDQLAGRGERVPVERIEEVELSRSVGVGEERAPREARAEPVPGPGPVDAPPPTAAYQGPGFAIQVGAFEEAQAARALARALRQKGLPGFVVEAASSPWRVRVGPYASEAEARRVAGGLRSRHELPTWVLPVGGS